MRRDLGRVRRYLFLAAVAIVVVALVRTSAPAAPEPSPGGEAPPVTGAPPATPTGPLDASPVLLAAGDVAACDSTGDEATAAVLDGQAGTVVMLGDGAYPDGSAADYANCYEPTWGRHKARTRPVPGNHDYVDRKGAGYYGYFGPAAGDPSKGYYSYDLGGWHIIALNSNCKTVGGCGKGTPQDEWVKADLAAVTTPCVMAYWHHPRFFSPTVGEGTVPAPSSDVKMSAVWRSLQAAGADVVLSGHRHAYERFPRMDDKGALDPKGIRQFVVGTGGGEKETFNATVAEHSEARFDSAAGVLKLSLRPDGYDWTFLPEAGQTATDAGSDTCSP